MTLTYVFHSCFVLETDKSILLLPYSYYGISCICQEMNSGKLILLGVIGFIAIAVNLWFAHWLGKKFK